MEIKPRTIGDIDNYYGGLCITEVDCKYYWIIENYDTNFQDLSEWSEIPKYLYDSLMKFDTETDKAPSD